MTGYWLTDLLSAITAVFVATGLGLCVMIGVRLWQMRRR